MEITNFEDIIKDKKIGRFAARDSEADKDALESNTDIWSFSVSKTLKPELKDSKYQAVFEFRSNCDYMSQININTGNDVKIEYSMNNFDVKCPDIYINALAWNTRFLVILTSDSDFQATISYRENLIVRGNSLGTIGTVRCGEHIYIDSVCTLEHFPES